MFEVHERPLPQRPIPMLAWRPRAPQAPLGFQCLERQSDKAGHAAGQRVALQPHEASKGRGAAPHRGPHLRPVQPLAVFGAQVHQDLWGDDNTVRPREVRGMAGW